MSSCAIGLTAQRPGFLSPPGLIMHSLYLASNSVFGQDHLRSLDNCNVKKGHLNVPQENLSLYVNVWVEHNLAIYV